MKKQPHILLIIIGLAVSIFPATAQTRISGILKTMKGETIPGANISLVNTYDGTSTDTAGKFNFITNETGNHKLKYTAIGYKADSINVNLTGKQIILSLQINEAVNQLNIVSITAGTLEAGDTKKGAVLSSLDVATTAGAVNDVIAALQTLPGTSQAFSENGLFVRGGSAAETAVFFDGMLVKNPYGSQLPDIASRSKFSSFLFQGTTFSSGGYSAQYGQALSSALLLQSKDLPEKTSTEFSLLSVGVGGAHTERFANSSLTVGGNYYNLGPAYSIIKQNIDWGKKPVEAVGNIQYKWHPTKSSMLKFFTQYNSTSVSLYADDPDSSHLIHLLNSNKSYYSNVTYQDYIGTDWKIQAGASYSDAHEKGNIDSNAYQRNNNFFQGRFTLTRYIGNHSLVRAGEEISQSGDQNNWNQLNRGYHDNIQASFVESELYLTDIVVVRIGIRAEHSSYIDEWNLAPRTSLAIKTGAKTQISMAYGTFYQNPEDQYLIQGHNLTYEKASHYLVNYQFLTSNFIFRAEAFYKKYADLTKYDFVGIPSLYTVSNFTGLNNGGEGYAKGIDIFFRDKKSIPNGDYYISYSYLDAKRDFRDYPIAVQPPFAAKNTLNIVYKQYIPSLHSEIGTTYSFSSGRTYYNPNNPVFLGDQTKSFNNLSANISYITRLFNQFSVVYASVTNLPGFNNVYGYNYSANGALRTPIYPAAKRNITVGLLITIGDDTFNH